MIEKLLTNELSLMRWKRFKSSRSAMISIWVMLTICFFSFTAEFWASSKPIVMKYQGKIFVPIFNNYHPSVFGRDDIFVMDYRALEFGEHDWAAWPLVQWDPFESNKFVDNYPSPPTKYNLLGTDDRGRDVLTRLLYGFRYSLGYAVGVWFLSYLLGTFIGASFGFFGGKLDIIGSRVVETIETIPYLLLLMTIISIFKPDLMLLIVFTVLFTWTEIFHQMRGQFLQLRKREFVEATRALGANNKRVIFKHILPNALTPLVTYSPFAIAGNISSLAVLDFLGFGLQAPTPSWGELMAQAQKYVTTAEWLVWAPGSALVLTMVSLILIGQAIRDAYDPRAVMSRAPSKKQQAAALAKANAAATGA